MRGNFSSGWLFWGFLAASICVCRGFSPLIDEERAYFQRVEQWKQKRIEEFRATHTAGPSSGLVPLTELGNRTYKGVEGGLYPGGKNAPPEPHLQAGLRLAREIVPRDGRGQPSQDGRIALLSVGMSNTTQEFQVFQQVAASPSRSAEAARATRQYVLQQERMARVTRHYGYPALRTPMDLPICRQLVTAVEEAAGKVVRLPTMGGSVPLYLFREQLGVPVVGLPTVNFDNNQHSPNENVRVGHFLRAIEIFAAVFGM